MAALLRVLSLASSAPNRVSEQVCKVPQCDKVGLSCASDVIFVVRGPNLFTLLLFVLRDPLHFTNNSQVVVQDAKCEIHAILRAGTTDDQMWVIPEG